MEVGCLWWWQRQDILSRGYVGRGPSTAGLQGQRALGVAQPKGGPLPAGQMGGYSSGDSDAQLLGICSVTDLLGFGRPLGRDKDCEVRQSWGRILALLPSLGSSAHLP